jgi:hypothetical protein
MAGTLCCVKRHFVCSQPGVVVVVRYLSGLARTPTRTQPHTNVTYWGHSIHSSTTAYIALLVSLSCIPDALHTIRKTRVPDTYQQIVHYYYRVLYPG